MKDTGIYATANEIKELQDLVKKAQDTPVIALTTSDMINGKDFASIAWDLVRKKCHELALVHGLPEISGYYGCTQDGKFVEA